MEVGKTGIFRKDDMMGYKLEKVGDNEELWKEIGFRNWNLELIPFSERSVWCADREKKIFVKRIGFFRGEGPTYFDLSFKKRIIRLEVDISVVKNENSCFEYEYSIKKISIPKSVWSERAEIITAIEESFFVAVHSLKRVEDVKINIDCEPECVEADYNDR